MPYISLGSSIVVVPPINQFIPVNSTENVTYTCNVSSAGNAVWQVQGRQIQNDDNPVRTNFADIGIFVNVISAGVTQVIITSDARLYYLNASTPNPNITLVCFSFPGGSLPTVMGDQLNVTTFGLLLVINFINFHLRPRFDIPCTK